MMYWKKGFYDESQGNSIEITDEYYVELLHGQSNGFSISENEEGYPILNSNAPSTIDDFKQLKVADIKLHDKSNAVNEFTIQDMAMWLDKNTRSCLKFRFDAEKIGGLKYTSLWYGNSKITLNIDAAIELLLHVELYASQCYDTTQQHIARVLTLTTVEDVNDYDNTIDYPNKLAFKLN